MTALTLNSRAISGKDFQLAYQPVVSTKNDRITGVEALIRWEHPERGQISPSLFIPIAEDANLIGPLGEWALRKACEDAARWPAGLGEAQGVRQGRCLDQEGRGPDAALAG